LGTSHSTLNFVVRRLTVIQLSNFEYYLFWLTAILVNGFLIGKIIGAIIEEIQEWHWEKYGKEKSRKEFDKRWAETHKSDGSIDWE